MTVSRDSVRDSLPNKGPAVEDRFIDKAIAGWTDLVRRKAGDEGVSSEFGELIITLAAEGLARGEHDQQEGGTVSEAAVERLKTAKDWLLWLGDLIPDPLPGGGTEIPSTAEDTEFLVANLSGPKYGYEEDSALPAEYSEWEAWMRDLPFPLR